MNKRGISDVKKSSDFRPVRNTRGVSDVVTTVLIILISIIAVIVLWGVTKGNLNPDADTSRITVDLKIKSASMNENMLNVAVQRNPGKGNLIGVAFSVFDSDGQSYTFIIPEPINEMEVRSFSIDVSTLSQPINVSVAGLFMTKDNKQLTGLILDSKKISSGTCTPESNIAFCSRYGRNCGSYTNLDNCGSQRTASCGSCIPPEACIDNACINPGCRELWPGSLLSQGLIGLWHFNNSLEDSAGDNDGTGFLTDFDSPKLGSHSVFVQSSAYVILEGGSGTNLKPTSALSAAFWVKPSNQGNNFFFQNMEDVYGVLIFQSTNDYLHFRIYTTDGGTRNLQSNYVFTGDYGKWVHVACTYDGAGMKIYINGNLDNSASKTGSIVYDESPSCFGWQGGGSTYWGDELAIWNRALSGEEISNLYNMQKC